jgi:hypothetical protein
MTGLTDLRAGTTEFFRFECIGDILEGSITRKFIVDFAAKYSGKVDVADGDDVLEATYALELVEDATWTHAAMITAVNTQTAL